MKMPRSTLPAINRARLPYTLGICFNLGAACAAAWTWQLPIAALHVATIAATAAALRLSEAWLRVLRARAEIAEAEAEIRRLALAQWRKAAATGLIEFDAEGPRPVRKRPN